MKNQFETILLEKKGLFYRLTLNRPESYNSINMLMHKELKSALKLILKDDEVNSCRGLLITGKGKGFCSGQDLNDRNGLEKNEEVNLGESLELRYNPLIKSLINLPFPTVCAVNGVAAGAGVSLALVCDLVIASSKASFVQAFSKIGLIPDSGSTWFLPRLIGSARSIGMMMLAEKITAEQAESWGLIWRQVEHEKLEIEAELLVKKLSEMPTQSLRQIKSSVRQGYHNSLNEQLDLERDLQGILGKTKDYQEGVSSFLEKRSPNFIGR